jgi:hypothetical protein
MEKVIKHTTLTTKALCDLIEEKGISSAITHNDDTVSLYGWGFEICLNINGTFWIGDTSGG